MGTKPYLLNFSIKGSDDQDYNLDGNYGSQQPMAATSISLKKLYQISTIWLFEVVNDHPICIHFNSTTLTYLVVLLLYSFCSFVSYKLKALHKLLGGIFSICWICWCAAVLWNLPAESRWCVKLLCHSGKLSHVLNSQPYTL